MAALQRFTYFLPVDDDVAFDAGVLVAEHAGRILHFQLDPEGLLVVLQIALLAENLLHDPESLIPHVVPVVDGSCLVAGWNVLIFRDVLLAFMADRAIAFLRGTPIRTCLACMR
jgi:hypothetical protein